MDGSGVGYTSAPEGNHDAIEATDGTQYYTSSQIIEEAVLESGESTDVSTARAATTTAAPVRWCATK